MLIYYCIMIFSNIAVAFLFHKNINISALSIVPILLIVIMIFQSSFFRSEKVENGSRTTYSSNFTDSEENQLLRSSSNFLLATIPWLIPFILFFPSVAKLLSVLLYILGLTGGAILYKFKHKGEIVNRINIEEQERQEQEKKEQLGKWK